MYYKYTIPDLFQAVETLQLPETSARPRDRPSATCDLKPVLGKEASDAGNAGRGAASGCGDGRGSGRSRSQVRPTGTGIKKAARNTGAAISTTLEQHNRVAPVRRDS